MPKETPPATVIQLAAALAALGAYNGANTAAEHAAEAQRLGGGEAYYRMRLANALLGNAELQATRAETAEGPEGGILLAHEQALQSAVCSRGGWWTGRLVLGLPVIHVSFIFCWKTAFLRSARCRRSQSSAAVLAIGGDFCSRSLPMSRRSCSH